jgi:[protein-PII] uridylyltransferase
MPELIPLAAPPVVNAPLRDRVAQARVQAQRRRTSGATGLQVAGLLSQLLDGFLRDVFEQSQSDQSAERSSELFRGAALLAVGGTGRGDIAPYSDADLLFLHSPQEPRAFSDCVSQTVRNYWDAGLQLGHSLHTVADAVRKARQDSQFATSLIEARLLCGSEGLFDELRQAFKKYVIVARNGHFIEECIAAREKERITHGAVVQQLEPDVKRSLGGLRDLHLLRWVGFARYGTADYDSLVSQGGLSADDVRRLTAAHEFLTGVRIDLHFAAGRAQDVLSREDQLRLAEQRGIPGTAGQRPVERFMQQYFEHTTTIADISNRFVERHRRKPWTKVARDYVMSFRVDDIYRIGPETVEVAPRHQATVVASLEQVLQLALKAVLFRVRIAPPLIDLLKEHSKELCQQAVTPAAVKLFLQILGNPGTLGVVLRTLYEVGVLETILPPLRHTRCLLQFNQYHSYTVDEHTLRTIECAERLEHDTGPLGRAYREIHHKELLHLALLLHDAGKGFEEDHSEIGRRLAIETAEQFQLPDHQRDLLVFLVHQHLLMATLAFRRDTADPEVLLKFNHDVGSPDALSMLFVLTAADISAVGPATWNDWKAELLAGFYDRSMEWLSGQSHQLEEPVRRQQVLCDVLKIAGKSLPKDELSLRLEPFPIHYLLSTPPVRIAADLQVLRQREPDDVHVESNYDPETGTVEYRVITSEAVGCGCFHKLTGVLSAKRMEILSAQICTSQDGIIVDSYRVRDYDHAGTVPDFRRDEIAAAIRRALRGELDVESLFRTRPRFSPSVLQGPVSDLPMRVVIDNETSDKYTVVDVFAHDRPGLLYHITRSLFELDLSVVLARISTHFDQVVDVFYVTDTHGGKIHESQRLTHIRDEMTRKLTEFEHAATQ